MVFETLNQSIFFAIQSASNPILDYFFQFVTTFGNPIFWIVISALLFWKGEEKQSFFLMNIIVVGVIFAGFFKSIFKFPRPAVDFQPSNSILEHNFKLPSDQYSFPSGHATSIAAAFTFFYNKIKKNWKIIFAIVLVLALISRVYLGKHFPMDVLGGLVLGSVVGIIMMRLNNKFFSNTQSRRELGLIVIGILFLLVVFLLDKFAVTTLPLGYYIGHFLFKQFGWDSPKLSGKRFYKKAFFGLIGFGAIMLYLLLASLPTTLQAVYFFLAGLWITLIFPFAYEVIRLKKKTITKYKRK